MRRQSVVSEYRDCKHRLLCPQVSYEESLLVEGLQRLLVTCHVIEIRIRKRYIRLSTVTSNFKFKFENHRVTVMTSRTGSTLIFPQFRRDR